MLMFLLFSTTLVIHLPLNKWLKSFTAFQVNQFQDSVKKKKDLPEYHQRFQRVSDPLSDPGQSQKEGTGVTRAGNNLPVLCCMLICYTPLLVGTALWGRLTDLCHLLTQLRCCANKAFSVQVQKFKALSCYSALCCVGRKEMELHRN